jgi:5-methylcytosine-specific restriction endonuclease McrA
VVSRKRPTFRAILAAAKAVCAECGIKDNLTVNHIRPIALGGTDDASNLEILCESCHKKFHGIDRSKKQMR